MGKKHSKSQCSMKADDDDFVTVKAYRGETKDGKRHGRGVYTYPNGDTYDGEWRKSRKYGRGVYTYDNGKRCAFPKLDVILLNYILLLHILSFVDEYLFANISAVASYF